MFEDLRNAIWVTTWYDHKPGENIFEAPTEVIDKTKRKLMGTMIALPVLSASIPSFISPEAQAADEHKDGSDYKRVIIDQELEKGHKYCDGKTNGTSYQWHARHVVGDDDTIWHYAVSWVCLEGDLDFISDIPPANSRDYPHGHENHSHK